MKRVVITGVGFYSPLGTTKDEVLTKLKLGENVVHIYEKFQEYKSTNTHLACEVTTDLPNFPRKKVRTAGRIGKLAIAATENAIKDSGLEIDELNALSCGVAYGSCGGSSTDLEDVAKFCSAKDVSFLNGTTYPAIMPHQAAVNIAIFFGIHGRIIATSTACTSGSQAIGYAYESIKSGSCDVMVAGGAEELSPYAVGVFDALYATSPQSNPKLAPRPFDVNRDGLVVGEGAGTLILEEYEHAQARGAKIYGEVLGFGTNCDAAQMTSPSKEYMAACLKLALKNAHLEPQDIGYINAHGTGTIIGDIAEGSATSEVMGNKIPVSTLNSYMGHTLGAAGALEAIFSMYMQEDGFLCPNLNLKTPDEKCGELDFIMDSGRIMKPEIIMTNNFAFGGVNTSLIIKKI